MHLARVRRTADAPVEIAARVSQNTSGGDRLVSLRSLDDSGSADIVALLDAHEPEQLAETVGELASSAAELLPSAGVVFEAPVAAPGKICCLALNYAAHAAEGNLEVPPDPVLFFKPGTAIIGHGATVRPPRRTAHVEHEVELAVVIGRRCVDVKPDGWLDVVAGYTIINDVTARDLQLANLRRNQPWDQAKCFDTFAPLGPYLVTPDEIADPHALELTLTVDGEVRQQANTRDMVFDLPTLIADLSDGMTLMPGDVIATGTTAGISPLRHGDVMHATIDGLGTLVNPIEFDPAS